MNTYENFFTRLRKRFSRRGQLSNKADEAQFFYAGESPNIFRDRTSAGFRRVIDESMSAWRDDPLARRIVSLTTQFSVGTGFRIAADDPKADAVLHKFWTDPLNRMDARILEWSDELCRTGNLFLLISTDDNGDCFVRAIPAAQVEEIIPQENDIEQPLCYRVRDITDPNDVHFPEDRIIEPASLAEPETDPRMLHFTVNRPVGGQWGEPDLAPTLVWLKRYREWLEDRMRLNHYRNSFLFTVKTNRLSEPMRMQRQTQLNLHPPSAGTILVTSPDEEWSVIQPNLESQDANEDGFAVKKMIAAGAGIPVSFLGESGANSKAESDGLEDSACRNFRQRQQTLLYITETLLRHVLARAYVVHPDFDPSAEVHVYGDNVDAPGFSEGGIHGS